MPAYTMGTGQKGQDHGKNTAFVPGPGAYQPEKKQKQQPPSFKIGTGPRGNVMQNFAPGPGAYQEQITKSGPKYTIAGKKMVDNVMFQPGPGAYNPSIDSLQKKQPHFSFGSKAGAPGDRIKVPGPGAYDFKSSVQDVPSSKFGQSKRSELAGREKTPGPGSSYGQNRASSAPRYGFGSANRSEQNLEAKKNPGPGQYDFFGAFERRDTKGFSMVSRKQDLELLNNTGRAPGPGAYNPYMADKHNQPSFKIGSSQRQFFDDHQRNPGPGTYENLHENVRPGSAMVRIGSAKRRPLADLHDTPGPGNYEIPSRIVEGPKVQMLGRKYDHTQHTTEFVPGPGTYSSSEFMKFRPQSAKIGTSQRPDFARTQDQPGPGNYDHKPKAPGPKWGFGSGLRPPLNPKNDNPGPGGYDNN